MQDLDQSQSDAFPEPLNSRRGDVTVFVRAEERAAVYMILQVHAAAGLSFKESCDRAKEALKQSSNDPDPKRTAKRLGAIEALAKAFEASKDDMLIYEIFDKAGFSLQPIERALLSITMSEITDPVVKANVFGTLSLVMPRVPQL